MESPKPLLCAVYQGGGLLSDLHRLTTEVASLHRGNVVDAVSGGWPAAVQLLQEGVTTGCPLVQGPLEVLQLTQEVEVWGNRGPALFDKPRGDRQEVG